MSKNLGVSRETIYECLDYLSHTGLLMDLYPSGRGNALVRKPGKIYLNNANLLNAIHGSLKLESDVGGIREAFFVNQVSALHKVALHDKGDFIIDEKWIIQVGGKDKNWFWEEDPSISLRTFVLIKKKGPISQAL